MNKTHKYVIQALAILIYGIYVLINRETVNPYFALVILCCGEIVITLLYLFANRSTLTRDESVLDFISIYAYIAVIIIISLWFLM